MTQVNVYLGREDRPSSLRQIASGKVRDIYEVDEQHLLFVTTDRVSAFDVVMKEGIPYKGAVLTAIAAHWFERTGDIVPGHLITTCLDDVQGLDAQWRERFAGRSMLVRRAEPDPIEWVVRGYIAGSGWKEYQRAGTICGIALPPGLQLAQALPEPILTPTTKHEEHDRPLTPTEAAEMIGEERYVEGERIVLELFRRGTQELAKLGVKLADTKFELGQIDGETFLIDEALTPDSSRFWSVDEYAVGISPPSYDKQILRDHLETLDWDHNYPPPPIDAEILERVGQRYLEICEMITGRSPMEVTS